MQQAVLKRAQEIANGLYPHQIEGVAFLLDRRRALLADAIRNFSLTTL